MTAPTAAPAGAGRQPRDVANEACAVGAAVRPPHDYLAQEKTMSTTDHPPIVPTIGTVEAMHEAAHEHRDDEWWLTAHTAARVAQELMEGPDAPLTFEALASANRSRCERWHPGFPVDGWTGADWATAMAGEAGEACNVVKKIRRADHGAASPRDPARALLLQQLGAELADTVIYLDLLAQHYGLDLAGHVVAKFNIVSEREGFPERLQAEGQG